MRIYMTRDEIMRLRVMQVMQVMQVHLTALVDCLLDYDVHNNTVPTRIFEHLKEVNIFLLNRLNGDES